MLNFDEGWGRKNQQDYLDNHRERWIVIKIVRTNNMYGRSSAMTPVTIMNRIVFVMNLFPLNLLFAIVPPFFEVEIKKPQGEVPRG